MTAGFVSGTVRLPRGRHESARAAVTRRPARMVAAKQASDTALSSRAQEMVSWVRAHKSIFSPGTGFTATHLALYRKNDTARCLVPADELDCNADMLPGVDVARTMLEKKDHIFEKAKADVLAYAPSLAENVAVADILWHDIAYFFRVVSYGAGVTSTNYIHANNLGIVKELYQEIGLSKDVVAVAVNSMKESVLQDVKEPSLAASTAACFDELSNFMTA